MNINVEKSVYNGSVNGVPSKSYAHRLLIASALKKGKTIINNIGNSKDVLATISCLNSLGASIICENGRAVVVGIKKPIEDCTFNAFESGSTLRFLIPIASAILNKSTFTGTKKLLSRPNEALYKTLRENGATIDGQVIRGKIKSGKYYMDASISSQYVTGLLFALPLLDGDSQIILENNVVSKNYLDITLEVLDLAKIKYEKTKDGFIVYGNQEYKLADELFCENDWSSASFMLVAGAIGKSVSVDNINISSSQGDKVIIDILKEVGANVSVDKNCIKVSNAKKRAFSVNIENAPDLAPVLSVLAVDCEGESRLYGVERLKIKESDRILAILNMLKSAKIECDYNGEYIKIKGGKPKGAIFNGENDHRIVMSAVLLAGLCEEESTVTYMEAVNKSYPTFFDDYKKIGGKTNVSI